MGTHRTGRYYALKMTGTGKYMVAQCTDAEASSFSLMEGEGSFDTLEQARWRAYELNGGCVRRPDGPAEGAAARRQGIGDRRRRTGTIYLDRSFKYYRRGAGYCQRNEWRAEIVVHGHRFRCRAGSYARCQAWCEDMVRKYGEF